MNDSTKLNDDIILEAYDTSGGYCFTWQGLTCIIHLSFFETHIFTVQNKTEKDILTNTLETIGFNYK